MDVLEQAQVITFHRRRLGGTPLQALGWRSPESQTRRFEALCSIGDLSHDTVLDLGCGMGDLRPFLEARFEGISYLGVDQMPELVEVARTRHSHLPRTSFLQVDFLNAPPPDVGRRPSRHGLQPARREPLPG